MNVLRLITTLALLATSSVAIADSQSSTLPIAELPSSIEVSYSLDIAPLLKRSCVACHNQSEDEGGINLESATTIENSDDDELLIPGKPAASKLFLCASHSTDPIMPPADNEVSATNLSALELAKLQRWIQQGARFDQQSESSASSQWQSLPASIKTVYACATTTDGRFNAIGFGNRIQIFAGGNSDPIATLTRNQASQTSSEVALLPETLSSTTRSVSEGSSQSQKSLANASGFDKSTTSKQTLPAHEDFVQSLEFYSGGQKVVSAGYRNIKFWEMQPTKNTDLPAIDSGRSLGVALSRSGQHLAWLSSQGELSVGRVGAKRWDWMKGFDLTGPERSDKNIDAVLAVSDTGDRVAVGIGQTIRIVAADSKTVHELELDSELANLCWDNDQKLVSATTDGTIRIWRLDETQWIVENQHRFDFAPSSMIHTGDRVLVIGSNDEIVAWDHTSDSAQTIGKLPEGATAGGTTADGKHLIVHSASGSVGLFQLSDGQFSERISQAPEQEAELADASWNVTIANLMVKVNTDDLTRSKADVAAEVKSLETIAKEQQTQSADQAAKQKAVEEAKRIAAEAAEKQKQAKSSQDSAAEKREQLASTIKKLDASIKDLEQQLMSLKQSKMESQQQLAAVPKEADLAAATKAASEAVEKANNDLASKESELSVITKSVQSTEKTQSLGERRLEQLQAESKRLEKAAQESKDELAKRKSIEDATKKQNAQHQSAIESVAVTDSGFKVVTQSKLSGSWNLWTQNGQWLTSLSDIAAEDKLISHGDSTLLFQSSSGHYKAVMLPTSLWSHTASIGNISGDSPFANRVLSVDVNPAGDLVATGGGDPSRSGELTIWNINDQSLVRQFDQPHGDTVLCVKFSPDGKTLATGGADQMIKLWDVATGIMIKTLEGHTHHVTSIAWNLTGRQIASASADATVKIWDVQTGKSTRTISGLKSEITHLVYLGADNRIGLVSGDEYFRVYRTDNGSRETNAKLPAGYLYGLAANRIGTQFVAGGAAGKAVVIDKTGKQLQLLESGD